MKLFCSSYDNISNNAHACEAATTTLKKNRELYTY